MTEELSNNRNGSKRPNSEVALEFLRRTLGGDSHHTSTPTGDNPNETDDTPHHCSFLFSREGWEHLHLIGIAIQTSEPSQIVRRALATIWLVASEQCELKDKITGKVVKIPD